MSRDELASGRPNRFDSRKSCPISFLTKFFLLREVQAAITPDALGGRCGDLID